MISDLNALLNVFNNMVGISDYTVLTYLLLPPSIAPYAVSVNTE